jgi:uncharacterized protein YabN with tetrapyrrole methylase and pyrophosphatase domain
VSTGGVISGTECPHHIYIVGLGITSVLQLTRETEAAFRRSHEVFVLPAGYGVDQYVSTLCARVTNLHARSYVEGVPRLEAYDAMAAAVIEAALDHPPVSLGLYGHPLVYAYPPQLILATAPFLGLRVKVLAAVSSLDTILVDLNLDPAMEGLQMYEATELLVRRRVLQPDVPCLIWQVGAVESNLYSEHVSSPERFERILRYLLEYYPAEHEVVSVYSSTHPLIESQLIHFPLGAMEAHHRDLHQALTLYIPPVKTRPIADHDLLSRLDSVAHLREITTEQRYV